MTNKKQKSEFTLYHEALAEAQNGYLFQAGMTVAEYIRELRKFAVEHRNAAVVATQKLENIKNALQ